MARAVRETRATRPEIFRAAMPFRGGQLVVTVTNGKRAVLFNDGGDVRYAMWDNEVARRVQELEKNLVRV